MENENSRSSDVSGCLTRLFWMGIGNFVLVLTAVGIGQNRAGFTLGAMDVLFWATAFGLLAVRYVDIRYLGGQTADSRPASMADWRRYAATVLGVSLALWLVAHWVS
jgi:hypothetical protein